MHGQPHIRFTINLFSVRANKCGLSSDEHNEMASVHIVEYLCYFGSVITNDANVHVK